MARHITINDNLWINTDHILIAKYSIAGEIEEGEHYSSSLTLVFDVKLFTVTNPNCEPEEGMYKLVLRGDQADNTWIILTNIEHM